MFDWYVAKTNRAPKTLLKLIAGVLFLITACGGPGDPEVTPPPASGVATPPSDACVTIPATVQAIRWAPDSTWLLAAGTTDDGTGHLWRVSGQPLEASMLLSDPLLDTFSADAGPDGSAFFARGTGDTIWRIQNGSVTAIVSPQIASWVGLQWTQSGFVVQSVAASESLLLRVDPSAGRVEEIFRTRGQIHNFWADPRGTSVAVAWAPWLEDDPDAGMTISVLSADREPVVLAPIGRRGRFSVSVSADGMSVTYVDRDEATVWRQSLAVEDDSSLNIVANLAEESATGRIGYLQRDGRAVRVCVH